ncbi:urease accessory protein UreF [Catenovulum agarivorans]|uniref:urease accessory protein UreF n=1 Tax=Catenovulum agarivorans TaxID=1172192 RepID=UPI000312DFF0|nr:urease accessory UreF family protein [Catenovulum agarivorans]
MAAIQDIRMHTNAINSLKLTRLLQLCSPGLPVGGFSFSQGLEYAVETGWVTNVAECENWITTNLQASIGTTDLIIIRLVLQSLNQTTDYAEVVELNQLAIASRESHELRLADVAMGRALLRVLTQQNTEFNAEQQSLLAQMQEWQDISFASAFAVACYCWQLEQQLALTGFCWMFIENQVAAATKLVPLGQTQAQNLMFSLSELVDEVIADANSRQRSQIGNSLPSVAMASAWHETQYSRLFRS